ncbi:MAG: Abi family protein [Bacteroidaceae bacterium]|nr:Abi family protein [Bacteroidaceae bacterium]
MTRKRIPYNKYATTYDEQIRILLGRGIAIADENKARECLADIGYYRLGFYIFPFELTYPLLDHRRSHHVQQGTTMEDVVSLYYFDLDLRNILNRYLSRIEVALRTTFVYELSTKYASDPYWFVNPLIVSAQFIADFPGAAYNAIKKRPTIKRHHLKYVGQYAPAWKTMEYMTLGNLEVLYDSLLSDKDKRIVSTHFGEPAIATFKSYMTTIREVRNACAHGNVLFGMTLTSGIRAGVACPSFPAHTQQTFHGALRVIDYMLSKVSANRTNDMWDEIYKATAVLYAKSPTLRTLIEAQTGIILPQKSDKNASVLKKIYNVIRKNW